MNTMLGKDEYLYISSIAFNWHKIEIIIEFY